MSVELSALSASECMILAILSALIIALPLNFMILMGLRKAAVADSHLRFPELARAANVRKEFVVALAGAPTSLLVAAVAAKVGGGEGGLLLTDEEITMIDESSLPGWEEPHSLVAGIASAAGAGIEERGAAASAARERTVLDADALARIVSDAASVVTFASLPSQQFIPTPVSALRDIALILVLGIASLYGCVFLLVRGATIAPSIFIAWVVGVVFFMIAVRVVDLIHVWIRFNVRGLIEWIGMPADVADAAALGCWMEIAETTAAAVAANVEADVATAALVDLSHLAAVWESRLCDKAKNVRIAALCAVFIMAKSTEMILSLRPTSRISSDSEPNPREVWLREQHSIITTTNAIGGSSESAQVIYQSPRTEAVSDSLMSHLRPSQFGLSPLPTAAAPPIIHKSSMQRPILSPLSDSSLSKDLGQPGQPGQRPLLPPLPGRTLSTIGRSIINTGSPSQQVTAVIPVSRRKDSFQFH